MEINQLKRIDVLCKYLIYKGYGDNEKELAEKLGYTKSSFSQLLNGKKPLNNKFISKLEGLDDKVNEGYILNSDISILKNDTSERVMELNYIIDLQKKLIENLESELKGLKKIILELENSNK